MCHICCWISFFILQIPFPSVKKNFLIEKYLWYAGLVAPDVFNQKDLKMSERWFVILDQNENLIPFTGFDGERLAMHLSDLLYYKISAIWRRLAIEQQWMTVVNVDSLQKKTLNQFIEFLQTQKEQRRFTVIYFKNNSANPHLKSRERYKVVKITEEQFN